MRISDWSSDVCSSDLGPGGEQREIEQDGAQELHAFGPRAGPQEGRVAPGHDRRESGGGDQQQGYGNGPGTERTHLDAAQERSRNQPGDRIAGQRKKPGGADEGEAKRGGNDRQRKED